MFRSETIVGSWGGAVRRFPARYVSKLEALFEAIDTKKSGMITEKQLSEVASMPNVHAYLETLGLDVKDCLAWGVGQCAKFMSRDGFTPCSETHPPLASGECRVVPLVR